jgi:hypothetical protein
MFLADDCLLGHDTTQSGNKQYTGILDESSVSIHQVEAPGSC